MDDTAAHDTAAFRFDSLPGVTLVATRYLTPRTTPDGHDLPVGFIEIDAHRDTPDPSHSGGHPGPTAPPSQDRPFVPGGKVPFMFRSLPGVTFYASRGEREVIVDAPPGSLHKATRWAMGWIRITYYLDGDDEEHEHASFAGPES